MIVYHGPIQEVQKPDISHSSHNLDFGKGFYVTTVKQQGRPPAVNQKNGGNDNDK